MNSVYLMYPVAADHLFLLIKIMPKHNWVHMHNQQSICTNT